MASERNDRDEDFRRAFGGLTNILRGLREKINGIRNNDPAFEDFCLSRDANLNVQHYFSDQAWELLGRYIANNDHLQEMDLADAGLTDEQMSILFKYLTGSTSLKTMDLSCNAFGPDGIRSMVPFLKNSSLTRLVIGGSVEIARNENINTECFGLLINALDGGSIEELDAAECSIDDVMAIEDCSLPRLKELNLSYTSIQNFPSLEKYTNMEKLWLHENNIGTEGCRSIAKLLQNPSSKLWLLDLDSIDVGDEGAEILANSLKYNTKLKCLNLWGNDIKEDGRRSFFKLLNDVSSIDGTYNSNHTLMKLVLPNSVSPEAAEMDKYIKWAIRINKEIDNEEEEVGAKYEDEEDVRSYEGNPKEAGRKKVVAFQLDSDNRMVMHRLQRMNYCYNSLFADIDPVLLPDILSIAGGNHGQNELYRMLIASVADLASIVDKKAALRERIAACVAQVADLNAEHVRKVAALDVKILEMKGELKSMESGGTGHHIMADSNSSSANKLSGKKRGRCASF